MNSHRKNIIDVAAIAALVWVAAAALHEGLGHGVACKALGGDPIAWSTFHFNCGRDTLSVASWRIISGAGTAVNVALMALGLTWWRRATTTAFRLAAWMIFTVNGLTTFGYLVFSAALGIGDWNSTGVVSGVANVGLARALLAVVGFAGYVAVIRRSATMLSPLTGHDEARLITTTVWLTTGIVSLLAPMMAGNDWRTTLGASIGVALGGNAGLLTIPRFVSPTPSTHPLTLRENGVLRALAVLAVLSFVAILGPGLSL